MGQLLGESPSTFSPEQYADDDIYCSFMQEAIHVIGFSHEFNRFDRNKYVRPLFENIREGST